MTDVTGAGEGLIALFSFVTSLVILHIARQDKTKLNSTKDEADLQLF